MNLKPYCLYLYRCLLQDLASIHRLPLGDTEMAEKCFHRSVHYWMRLVNRVKGRNFSHPFDEIVFFKELKPLFSAEAEYYSLLYHAALFKPLDTAFLKPFWIKELERVEVQLHKVPSFYAYYRSGKKDQDGCFFNRAKGSLDLFMMDWNHVGQELRYDLLISQYMAIEKYKKYIGEQLYRLEQVIGA